MKAPIAIVKERFGDKAKLIAAIEKFTTEDLWLSKVNTKGLKSVPNAKLIRLHDTFSKVKERFGTRFKLIDALLELEKRGKDEGYRKRLLAYPVPRLFDMYRSLERRQKRAATKPVAPTGAPSRAKDKKPAAKRTASKG